MNLEDAREKTRSHLVGDIVQGLRFIGENGTLADLQSLINNVKHDDERIRKTAVSGATALILHNLLEHFSELDPQLRAKLGTIMESLDPAIISEISKELYSEDEQRRLRAVQILGLLRRNPNIRGVLAELVQDRDVKIRATAVNLLGKFVGPNDHQMIMSLLSDKDKRVRANTVEALEAVGNKRLVPILLRLRKDPSNRIRGNVIKALYNLGFTEIEGDLTAMLESKDNFMKASALWVISQIKLATTGLEDLAGQCLISEDEMVLRNARNALTAMATPRAKGYVRYLAETIEPKPA